MNGPTRRKECYDAQSGREHWYSHYYLEVPALAAKAGRTMSGLDYLKAMQAGTVPPSPIALLMNMGIAEETRDGLSSG